MSTRYIVCDDLNIKASSNPDYYEIFNNRSKRTYRVTSSMYKVLTLFEKGSCEEDVIEKIAQEANTYYDTISNVVSPFIRFLIKSKSIVHEASSVKMKNVFNSGDKFKNYIIEEAIACNNKGEVYKCYDNEKNNYCILKIFNRQRADSSSTEQELASLINKEFEITGKAAINNCWVIKPVEKIHDTIYGLVLEFFDGNTVPKFLTKRKQNITKEAIEKLVFQTVDAFELIHSYNILHGDIHSNNILINDQFQIKIIDFGLAHDLGAQKKSTNFGGVSFFCPPERIGSDFQHKFKSKGNFVSEVYQIGLIIYFFCFGKLPFKGYTWQELRSSILTDTPSFATHDSYKEFDWSHQFKEFLSIALHKSPEQRFQSVIEMKRHLRKITV